MTYKTCAKCVRWRRSSPGVGMCVALLQVMGSGDTCDKWEAKEK